MKVTFRVKLRPAEYEEEVEIPDGFTQHQIDLRCKYWVRCILEQAVERPSIDVHHIVSG